MAALPVSAPAQYGGDREGIGTSDPQFGRHRNQEEVPDPALEKQRAIALNKDRQKQLKRDTDRLLQLATELKLQVDKSNESVLSLDVMHKAEEIEKLAHSVRTKMKGE